MTTELKKIGLKHRTDKATHHQFMDFYASLFEAKRFEKINVLEIGVLDGSSLRTWEEYFPAANIYAVDIEDKQQFETARIKTTIADQGKLEEIGSVFDGVNFDIIIDDGGHTMLQQQVTLAGLFDRLKPGGIYVLEDLHTSLESYIAKARTNPWISPEDKKTTLALVEAIAKHENSFEDYRVSSDVLKRICAQVGSVHTLYNNKAESVTAMLVKD